MITSLPSPLRWLGEPAESSVKDGVLQIIAGPRTDLFVHPQDQTLSMNAPALVCSTTGDFLLAARVEVAFAATFDAGALLLWKDDRTWAKLCFEYSPQKERMVVSVVTRGFSDDCNSQVADGDAVWLRLARIGQAHAFHATSDGRHWELVRHFRLDGDGELDVGFVAQSPTGDGCAATFSEIRFDATTLTDLRSGE